MVPVKQICGFDPTEMRVFQLQGRTFSTENEGFRCLELLANLALEVKAGGLNRHWLVKHRHQVRELESTRPNAQLTYIVEYTRNESMRCLAIWLLGRCRGKIGTEAIAAFRNSRIAQVRKEVVRALVRLNAWNELFVCEYSSNSAPAVHPLARRYLPSDHKTRLGEYLSHVQPLSCSPSPTPLWVHPEVSFGVWQNLKSIARIRQLLERIRKWVHGIQGHH